MTEHTLTAINDWQPGRRYAFDKAAERAAAADIVEEDFWEILEKVWEYSAVSTVTAYNFYSALRHVLDQGIEGDVIECGVFFGGMIMLAGHVLKRYDPSSSRRLIAMDTFTGFVRRDTQLDVDYDGVAVCHATDDPNGAGFLGVSASNMKSVGFDRLDIIKGDVTVTIPQLPPRKISILRLDTDTYDTTKAELELLFDRVSVGGVVIIDDYGFTIGCKKAVNDFIQGKKLFPIRVDRWCRTFVKVQQ